MDFIARPRMDTLAIACKADATTCPPCVASIEKARLRANMPCAPGTAMRNDSRRPGISIYPLYQAVEKAGCEIPAGKIATFASATCASSIEAR